MSAQPKPDFSEVRAVFQTAVAENVFPGCVAAVGNRDGLWWLESFGHMDQSGTDAVKTDAVYDLASLTKVVGTTAVLMKLVAAGKLDTDSRVADHLPEFPGFAESDEEAGWRRELTISHLLRHTGGLVSWRPYFREVDSYEDLLRAVMATPLERRPGGGYRYSDPGFILLGEIAARAGGTPLPELEESLVFTPLGMQETRRNPPPDWRQRIPPTECDPDGDGFLHGVVHDENARAAGGVTGHAGLFSTAEDLARFAGELLRAADGQSDWLPREVLGLFTTRDPASRNRGLGWGMAPGGGEEEGRLSREAFGHTGFTGTSIWIDPGRNLFLILLSNRVHPTRENSRIGPVRADFTRTVVRAVAATPNERP